MKKTLYNPHVSLRVLQILCICNVILTKTYYTIGLTLWIIITGIDLLIIILKGFTFDMTINYYTSIILGIPTILANFFTFYYGNIPHIADTNNPYMIC